MTRIAVIGDVGGHLTVLRRELIRLGADAMTLELPADLVVVQVGDLVHRGPESEAVVALVEQYPREQWLQLVGNHEAQYLAEPTFEWPERIAESSADTLRSWWASGRMTVAAAVRADGADWLITHAGLTEGFWRRALDAPTSAELAAAALNSFAGRHDAVLFSPGQMLGGGRPNLSAGPVWASAGPELIASWLGQTMPFHQLHGHSSVMNWWRTALTGPAELSRLISVDVELSHTVAAVGGGRIVGVDPGHGRAGRAQWGAFVLNGSVLPGHLRPDRS